MNINLKFSLATAITFCFTASAAAQVPVAVVEHVKGKPIGVEFMDYVSPGKVIKLGPNDSIVIGYMKSCWRETITGGTVTVGSEQSTVQFGSVERTKVACDLTFRQITEQQQSASGATVFRSIRPVERSIASSRILIYGTSPVFEMEDGGTLVIERLDMPGERHEIVVDRQSLVRGAFYDFAKAHRALTPGASYVALFGGRKRYFSIDLEAKPGSTPIIGRLLRFD